MEKRNHHNDDEAEVRQLKRIADGIEESNKKLQSIANELKSLKNLDELKGLNNLECVCKALECICKALQPPKAQSATLTITPKEK